MARLICLEGLDRVGKATQAQLLEKLLISMGYSAVRIEVPVKDKYTHKLIYKMLKNGLAKYFPLAFQTVQFVNRLLFQKKALPSLVKDNDFIIFDRWSASSYVYGKASGVSEFFLRKMMNKLVQPDVTIVLDGESHVNEYRDVYEKDRLFQRRVRAHYIDFVSRCKCCATVIDASRKQFDVLNEIVDYIDKLGMLKQKPKEKKLEKFIH